MTIQFSQSDIEGSILAALLQVFQNELQTPVTDSLKLKYLGLNPFQNDPIANAPYLTFGPAYEIGRKPITKMEMGGMSIGGPSLWSTAIKATVGTPQANDRATAYGLINELSHRVEETVMKHFDLSNILAAGTLYSPDRDEWIDAMNPQLMWKGTSRRIYGGDNQFYGQAIMVWAYTFSRQPTWLAGF